MEILKFSKFEFFEFFKINFYRFDRSNQSVSSENIFSPAIGGSLPVGQQRHTEEALPKLADLKKRRHYLAAYCKLFAYRYFFLSFES